MLATFEKWMAVGTFVRSLGYSFKLVEIQLSLKRLVFRLGSKVLRHNVLFESFGISDLEKFVALPRNDMVKTFGLCVVKACMKLDRESSEVVAINVGECIGMCSDVHCGRTGDGKESMLALLVVVLLAVLLHFQPVAVFVNSQTIIFGSCRIVGLIH